VGEVRKVRVPTRVPGRSELLTQLPVLGWASACLVEDTQQYRKWHVVWKKELVARVEYSLGGFRFALLAEDGITWVVREPVLNSMSAAVREAVWELESIG
jgi:hypothetical protein